MSFTEKQLETARKMVESYQSKPFIEQKQDESEVRTIITNTPLKQQEIANLKRKTSDIYFSIRKKELSADDEIKRLNYEYKMISNEINKLMNLHNDPKNKHLKIKERYIHELALLVMNQN